MVNPVRAEGLERLRGELSGRDVVIIETVADARLMTGGQLQRLFFPLDEHATATSAGRCCRRVLARLARHGLLVRLEGRRIGGVRAGSAANVYGLGPVGHRLLQRDRPRPRYVEPTETFVRHIVAVAEIAVRLREAARCDTLELLTLQHEPASWRNSTGMPGIADVRPDLYTAVAAGEFEYHWFVEADLGTESLPRLLTKCAAYEAYYRSGTEQADHGVFPQVLWLMPTTKRLERLHAALGRSRQLTDRLFVLTTHDRAIDVIAGGQL